MSTRAERLAREFAEANDALARLLERATPEQWLRCTRDEGELRPIGIIAHHVAWAHHHINQRVRAFAEGLPVPPRRPDLFDERMSFEEQERKLEHVVSLAAQIWS
jgi:hypothetical protein